MKTLLNYLASAIVGAGLLFNVATTRAESLSGKVYDALTSQTMNSFPVQLDDERKLTDLNGNYNFTVPQGNHHLKISDNITNYFNYEEDINITTDIQKNVYMIPKVNVDIRYYRDFLHKFKHYTMSEGNWVSDGGNTIFCVNWKPEFRPIPFWYNETQANDILGTATAQIYFNTCDLAINEWENKTRLDLFQRVYKEPEVGIIIRYNNNSSGSGVNRFPDNTNKLARIFIDNNQMDEGGVERLLWEFKHEIDLCFLDEPHFRYDPVDPSDVISAATNGIDPGDDISQNDSDIMRIIHIMPLFTNMSHYNNTRTANAVKSWCYYE